MDKICSFMFSFGHQCMLCMCPHLVYQAARFFFFLSFSFAEEDRSTSLTRCERNRSPCRRLQTPQESSWAELQLQKNRLQSRMEESKLEQ